MPPLQWCTASICRARCPHRAVVAKYAAITNRRNLHVGDAVPLKGEAFLRKFALQNKKLYCFLDCVQIFKTHPYETQHKSHRKERPTIISQALNEKK